MPIQRSKFGTQPMANVCKLCQVKKFETITSPAVRFVAFTNYDFVFIHAQDQTSINRPSLVCNSILVLSLPRRTMARWNCGMFVPENSYVIWLHWNRVDRVALFGKFGTYSWLFRNNNISCEINLILFHWTQIERYEIGMRRRLTQRHRRNETDGSGLRCWRCLLEVLINRDGSWQRKTQRLLEIQQKKFKWIEIWRKKNSWNKINFWSR